ncbi:MAG: hypothetical protein QXF07_00610 [Candidatus Micrarchaeia archaeon]
MNKKKRREVLGIIISSEDKRDIGRIVSLNPKKLKMLEQKFEGKRIRQNFLNPGHEEIMKMYKKFYSAKKLK